MTERGQDLERRSSDEMTTTARAALGYLADRSKQAIGASAIAEWVGHPLPKVQAGLMDLRERGFVRYFPGHPGTWSVTANGYREVDVGVQSNDRYRMALEALEIVVNCDAYYARQVAKGILGKALGR